MDLHRHPSRAARPGSSLRSVLVAGVVAALCATTTGAHAAAPSSDTRQLSGELVVAVGQYPHAEHATAGTSGDSDRVAAIRTSDLRLHPVDAADVRGIAPGSEVVATVTTRVGSAPADVERITVADRASTDSAAATAAATTGPHQVFAVLVTPAGGTPDPAMDAGAAAAMVANASTFWSAQSNGAVTFDLAATTPAYRSAHTCAQPFDLWSEAADRTPGFTGAPGQHLALFLPHSAYDGGGCAYGLGTLGQPEVGAASGGLLYVADVSSAAFSHELGHNLSLEHANSFSDAAGEQPTTAGVEGYGDRSDVMGPSFPDEAPFTAGNLSAVQQARLGLLPVSHRATVTAVGTSSRTLAALDRTAAASASAPRLLTVTDPRNGLRYSVEYRSARGFDAHNRFGAVAGVRILRNSTVAPDETVLVDTTRASGRPGDQALTTGRSWSSVGGGVRITVTRATLDSATITLDVTGDPVAPVVTTAADATWFTPGHVSATVTPTTASGTVTFSARTGSGAWQPIGAATVTDGAALVPWTPVPTAGAPSTQVRASFTPSTPAFLAATGEVTVTPQARSTTTALRVSGAVATVTVAATGTTGSTTGTAPRGTVDLALTSTATGGTAARTATLAAGTAAVDLAGLPAGTWTVRATYAGDSGTFGYLASLPSASAPATATVAAVPAAPTGVTAVAADRSATVTWTAPPADGTTITHYTVTASPGGRQVTTTGATSATLTGLVNGTSYTFTVTATNAAGTGPASDPSPAVRHVELTDVKPGDRFAADIAWLVERGVTTGYTDGTFRPVAPVSRQAMAAFLYRFAGSPAVAAAGASPFRDVPVDGKFHDEVQWLSAQGISTGTLQTDGARLYKPVDAVSRQAMAAFLYRAAGSPAFTVPTTPTFADVPAQSTFFREVEWLASTGITTGSAVGDGTTVFNPVNPVSRQAMAAFLHRMDQHLAVD